MAEDAEGHCAAAEQVGRALDSDPESKVAADDAHIEQKTDKDGQVEQADFSGQVLGSITGITYPVISAQEMVYCPTNLLAGLYMCLRNVHVLVPDAQMAATIYRWSFVPTIMAVSSFFIFILYTAPSLQQAITCLVLEVVLIYLQYWLFDGIAVSGLGFMLCVLVFARKLQGRIRLAISVFLIGYVVFYAFFVFVRYFWELASRIPDNMVFLLGAMPTLSGSILSSVIPFLWFRALRRFGPCGVLPPLCACEVSAYAETISSSFRVGAMIANADSPGRVLSNFVIMAVLDLSYRLPLLEYLCARCRIPDSWWRIDGQKDLDLRLKFPMNYIPVLPGFVVAGLASAAGAPWARSYMWVLCVVLYAVYNVLVDFLIVMLHRVWYPVPSEALAATFARLRSQPRANWPAYQEKAEAAVDLSSLWKPSCLARLHPKLDERVLVFYMLISSYHYVLAIAAAIHTPCYLAWHPSHCE